MVPSVRDDSKYGYDSDGQNFYLKIHHEFQKMVLISLKDLYKIHIFPKFHRCGSKIVPATPFWNLNFKWAWQAEFLSHNLLSLQNCLFFTNKEMMLMSFFEINDGIWDKNFACHCHIHVLSHPCISLHCPTSNRIDLH